MNRRLLPGFLGLTLALGLHVAPVVAENATPQARLAARASALVSVRYVLKVQSFGTERELDGETTCLVVDAQGLLLCSNNEMGGHIAAISQLINRGDMPSIAATPKEIRVLLGADAKGQPARLIARDSDRDLAWLQLDAVPANVRLEPLDIATPREAAVGTRIYRLRRLDRYFGSAPIVESGAIGAVVDHPRPLLIATDFTGAYLGMPIFDEQGGFVGLTIAQLPGEEERGALERPRGLPGQSTKFDDMVGRVILPAAEVLRATRLAQEIHAADAAGTPVP